MAKKKKKHQIKLNNTIRSLFDGKPFDEAVATLSDEMLTELVLLTGVQTETLDRESMIRALRRLWSDKHYPSRKAIVAHLVDRQPSAGNARRTPVPATDKISAILDLLRPHDPTPEEEEAIVAQFVENAPGRITPKRITNALRWHRYRRRIEQIENTLSVAIDEQGRMVFYHSFLFPLPAHDFNKTLQVSTPPTDWQERLETVTDETALLDELRTQKEAAVTQKQEAITRFVAHLFARPHPYLSSEQIETYLRRMPPEGECVHAPIDFMVCEQIVRQIDEHAQLIHLGESYAVEKERTIRVRDMQVPYRVRVEYDKAFFYATIWRGEPLPVTDDLATVDRQMRNHFAIGIDELLEQARQMARDLPVDERTLWEHIRPFLEPQLLSSGTLRIPSKTRNRILYHLGEYLRPLREKKLREELLAQTIRDFKRLFPLARELGRKIIFHAGPTNSGKTWAAMEQLRAAQTGYYLAPLRLLALEGYESLREHGVAASLITGEEEILDPRSTHISSTIEMLNFEADVDCCVIDEIQMIADRDRGWAWANALIGTPARTVILTGSADAIPAVKKLAEYLQEELKILEFKRMNPLELLRTPVPLKKIKPHTAVVAFSRKEVLAFRQRLAPHHRVSVIYGNLSPEVRREEARKFREGESDVLVATDAIAMGLNLPIRTLLFARDNKFDGLRRRELTTTEILQIAGRAGRYGLQVGHIGALDGPALETISQKFHAPLPPIELPVSVMASLHHVMLIGEILQTDDLLAILTFFADNMEFEGPFRAANIESMLAIAEIVGQYDLDLRARYHLATAPVGINSPYIESVFHRYLKHLEKEEPVPYLPPRDLPAYAHTNEELLLAEDRVKEVSLYLWLSFRFPGQFPDTEAATRAREQLNRYIETSLSKGDFVKRCRRCGAPLDLSYRFSICESCYRKGKTGQRSSKKRRY